MHNLYDYNMKPGAYLVGIFSIAFPFLKLFSLMFLYCLPKHWSFMEGYLNFLNQVGRYSLMDIDIAVALVVVAYNQ